METPPRDEGPADFAHVLADAREQLGRAEGAHACACGRGGGDGGRAAGEAPREGARDDDGGVGGGGGGGDGGWVEGRRAAEEPAEGRGAGPERRGGGRRVGKWSHGDGAASSDAFLPAPVAVASPPPNVVRREAEGYKLFLSRNDVTGYVGVTESPTGRFVAARSDVTIGMYDTAVEAAVAYARHMAAQGIYPNETGAAASSSSSAAAAASSSSSAAAAAASPSSPAATPLEEGSTAAHAEPNPRVSLLSRELREAREERIRRREMFFGPGPSRPFSRGRSPDDLDGGIEAARYRSLQQADAARSLRERAASGERWRRGERNGRVAARGCGSPARGGRCLARRRRCVTRRAGSTPRATVAIPEAEIIGHAPRPPFVDEPGNLHALAARAEANALAAAGLEPLEPLGSADDPPSLARARHLQSLMPSEDSLDPRQRAHLGRDRRLEAAARDTRRKPRTRCCRRRTRTSRTMRRRLRRLRRRRQRRRPRRAAAAAAGAAAATAADRGVDRDRAAADAAVAAGNPQDDIMDRIHRANRDRDVAAAARRAARGLDEIRRVPEADRGIDEILRLVHDDANADEDYAIGEAAWMAHERERRERLHWQRRQAAAERLAARPDPHQRQEDRRQAEDLGRWTRRGEPARVEAEAMEAEVRAAVNEHRAHLADDLAGGAPESRRLVPRRSLVGRVSRCIYRGGAPR